MDLDFASADPPEDHAGWKALIAFTDEMLLAILPPPATGTSIEAVTMGGVPAYDVQPAEPSSDLVCLYVHGGGLTMGGGEVTGRMTATFAEARPDPIRRSSTTGCRPTTRTRRRSTTASPCTARCSSATRRRAIVVGGGVGRRQPRRRARAPGARRGAADAGASCCS